MANVSASVSETKVKSTSSQNLTIIEAFDLSSKMLAAGELPEAEGLLQQIINTNPNHAHALHLLAIIAHQVGKNELAIELTERAVGSQKNEAVFHVNLCELYRQSGNLDKALNHGKEAVRLAPSTARAHSNLGIVWYEKKEYEQAHTCQHAALKLKPDLVQALNNLGCIRRQQHQLKDAIDYFTRALVIKPDHLEVLNNLGEIYTIDDRPDEAVNVLKIAIKQESKFTEAHYNLGRAYLLTGDNALAKDFFNAAARIRPDYSPAHEGLARLFKENNQYSHAERSIKHAISLDPGRAESYSLLGSIYADSGFPMEAEVEFDRAINLDNEHSNTYLSRGHLMTQLGHFDKAEADYNKAKELSPGDLAPHLSLAQTRKTTPEDKNFTTLLKTAENLSDLPELKAMSLHFALGKCHDDLNNFDVAFPHFLEACRIKRQRITYDSAENDQLIENIKQIFKKPLIERLSGHGDASSTPIFVLGMPRSGTTLTEQIIASHPDVYGAGELPDIIGLANQLDGDDSESFPLNMINVDLRSLKKSGRKYVADLKKRSPGTLHITDKMPANFLYIGLIHLMLPNAKIIHVKRHPLDTCLSQFTRLFKNGQFHSYNLVELGHYYRNYRNLMDHWQMVLPSGAFCDIQYETLVTNIKDQSKQLIDYCGLRWHEDCLAPHKNKRAIHTASVTQVRQPVYTSSIERWQHYEKHLKPLMDAIGDLN